MHRRREHAPGVRGGSAAAGTTSTRDAMRARRSPRPLSPRRGWSPTRQGRQRWPLPRKFLRWQRSCRGTCRQTALRPLRPVEGAQEGAGRRPSRCWPRSECPRPGSRRSRRRSRGRFDSLATWTVSQLANLLLPSRRRRRRRNGGCVQAAQLSRAAMAPDAAGSGRMMQDFSEDIFKVILVGIHIAMIFRRQACIGTRATAPPKHKTTKRLHK